MKQLVRKIIIWAAPETMAGPPGPMGMRGLDGICECRCEDKSVPIKGENK